MIQPGCQISQLGGNYPRGQIHDADYNTGTHCERMIRKGKGGKKIRESE